MAYSFKLEHDGLEFSMFPSKAEYVGNTLYRTGDEIEFLLSIRNKSPIIKYGKIPIVCRYGIGYGNPLFTKIFALEPLKPDEGTGFTISVPSKIEGNVLITIPTIGTIESFNDMKDEEIISKLQNALSSFEVIYSIHIMDRGVYYQQKQRDELLIQKLDSLPKVILDEVDRRLNATKSDIIEEVERKMQELQPSKESASKEFSPKKPTMEAIK